MNSFLKKYFKGDQGIWGIYMLLCVVSTIVMFSASSFFVYQDGTSHLKPIMEHIFYLVLGGFFAWALHMCSVKFIRLFGYIVGIAFFVALCLMYVPGIGVKLNGALRWVHILVTFQPSEGAKLGLVLIIADLLSRVGKLEDSKIYWAVILCAIGICMPILPSNFSTVALIGIVVIVMLMFSDLAKKWRRISFLVLSALALCFALYFVVKVIPADKIPEPLERVNTWVNRVERKYVNTDQKVINPMDDMHKQITHGKIAIARGGLFGVGPGNSIQRDYVPLAFADSIFTIIVEEYGLIGGVFVLMLYMALFFRVGRMAIRSGSAYTVLASIGLTLMMILQVLVNVWVVLDLMPVTGQGLPLIGHGGTSILITSLNMGVLLALSNDVEMQYEAAQQEKEVEELQEEEDKDLKVIDLEDDVDTDLDLDTDDLDTV
ncbi:MAG: FtsW/RodA/SpoVE family cell cycle protein [Paludibacteraceae bacterium]|nr:FtsW/RodA/SpoVE family cell cycle protein [Paludibacteraceae bacterium]